MEMATSIFWKRETRINISECRLLKTLPSMLSVSRDFFFFFFFFLFQYFTLRRLETLGRSSAILQGRQLS